MKCVILSLVLLLSFHISDAQHITWYQHIAPIIHRNCSPCHRDGDAAPFSLITYEDVAKRAAFIKKVTQSHYMPPWKPDPHYRSFINERRLTEEEITMIADWADHNMPKGKFSSLGDTSFIPGTKYNRKPDLVLTMKQPFVVKGDNMERFVVFKIPFELPDSMNVEAIEFTSANKKLIHHANYEIDDVADSLNLYNTVDYINLTEGSRLDYQQYVPYRKKMIYYGGWIPGTSYESYPKDIGWIMPKRGIMLLTIHYAPVGKEEADISGIQLFFTKTPVKRQIRAVSIGSGGIGEKSIDPYFYIPANVTKSFTLKVTAPEDQSFLYVWPHMHNLGKSFKAYGVTPAGDTIRFISIADWSFKWQEPYWFQKLQKIPQGTVLTVEATYDNTINNPANPFNPPQLTYSSGDMKTTDEMLTLVMIYLPYMKGDEEIIMK